MFLRAFLASSLLFAAVAQAQTGGQSAAPGGGNPPQPKPRTADQIAAELFKGRRTETLTPAVTPLVVAPFAAEDKSALASGAGIPSRGSLLAEQEVRAAEGIAIQWEGERRILPLSIIGRLDPNAHGAALLPKDASRRAWCNDDDEKAEGFYCYLDKDADGRLETRRRANSRLGRYVLGLTFVREEESMDPMPYTPVPAGERPAYLLQYRRCRSGNEKVVYELQLNLPGRRDGRSSACSSLAKPLRGIAEGAAGDYQIDRIVVRKMGAESDASFRLVKPIPPGTLLDRIDPDEPVADLGTRAAWWQERIEEQRAMSRPAYNLKNGAQIVKREGDKGDIMFSGMLGYGYTGRISSDAVSSRLLSHGSRDLAAGQFVYGLPMMLTDRTGRGRSEPQIHWCAPIRKGDNWTARCIPSGETAQQISGAVNPPFMAQRILGSWWKTEAVSVRQEPIEFSEPILVRYEFREFGRRSLTMRIHSGPGGGGRRDDWFQFDLPRPEGRAARMRLGGALYEITAGSGGKGYRIVELEPPRPGGSAMPSLDLPEEVKRLLRR